MTCAVTGMVGTLTSVSVSAQTLSSVEVEECFDERDCLKKSMFKTHSGTGTVMSELTVMLNALDSRFDIDCNSRAVHK